MSGLAVVLFLPSLASLMKLASGIQKTKMKEWGTGATQSDCRRKCDRNKRYRLAAFSQVFSTSQSADVISLKLVPSSVVQHETKHGYDRVWCCGGSDKSNRSFFVVTQTANIQNWRDN